VYVAGYTDSTDFPKTFGGAQQTCNGCDSGFNDAFVARLSPGLAAAADPIPTLDRWGLLALLACLGTAGVLLLRRVVA
jgi:hypothetical protein